MITILKRLLIEEKGQGLAEYGLILALVALTVVGALTLLGDGLNGIFGAINGKLETVPAP